MSTVLSTLLIGKGEINTSLYGIQETCVYTAAFNIHDFKLTGGSSGCRVVKLLACGARGPGFDSRPRHLNFQRLVISCFQVEIWLKDC